MGLIEQAFIHLGQGKGQAGTLEKGEQLRLGLITTNVEGGEGDWASGFF